MGLETKNVASKEEANKFDFKKAISTYLKHWKWFVLSALIAFGIAYYIAKNRVPLYSATSKIMLLDNKSGQGNAVLQDLSLMSNEENSMVNDEIQVIKSRKLLGNVAEKLNLNITYHILGRVNEYELYKNTPVEINFLASDSIIQKTNSQFYLHIISDSNFEFKLYEDDISKKYAFGESIPTSFGDIIITPKGNIKGAIDSNIRVSINSIENIIGELTGGINLAQSGEGSKIVDVYMDAPNVHKSIDIINTLIDEYNLATIEKNRIRAEYTSNFIDDRVESLTSDLVSVDDSIVKFKVRNQITNISSKSGMLSTNSMSSEQELQEMNTKRNMLEYMLGLLETNTYEMIPSNLGVGDASISGLAVRYNELLERRRVLLKSAGENNSVVLELDQSLNSIKKNLIGSVNNNIRTLSIQSNSIQNQLSSLNSKISYVPAQESKLISIQRRQSIKESLYLYLLQKREEAEISQTTTLPSAKIIDSAYSLGRLKNSNTPLYFGTMLLGFLIPFGFIYIMTLMDTKIHNKEDLENHVKTMTVLGEIPNIKSTSNRLITYNDRSILSESFRIIRTNFEFLNRDVKAQKYRNVIFVTSTINGEGKSFVSVNTALTLANTGKKVLLIGSDLRNPQIFSAIKKDKSDVRTEVGLSEYLSNYSVKLSDTINTREVNKINIDILLSGQIPPNPAELLMDKRLEELFDTVSEAYDYVVVDTAPSMLVTDTLLMHKYAAHTLYVTRAGYTEKRILNFAKELKEANKLNHMMLVVNDVKEANFGYGAKYGYYGTPEKKSFFKRKKKA
ncbi:polysaccharide biosynthesis tyrosine autokinase [Tamlana sp. 2_MG-2023]|uniref:GumC family protein n=1 Tax=unclassified Tamlana TaxID=2614803 RepID=UPI0026E264A1|nr:MULTISPECIES: tyrosine-protein kinase [unclassified Tamlana]MDO6759428.1 polysaccharide biosynthesis tyrosine autokinase [Tamlana sp. 2_MG-2023]MDO6790433.1 polysaccharide biosynthesis tyrosine autokinase [Tamlana sp. 1_MG-2023]